jgi:hypothetical protein
LASVAFGLSWMPCSVLCCRLCCRRVRRESCPVRGGQPWCRTRRQQGNHRLKSAAARVAHVGIVSGHGTRQKDRRLKYMNCTAHSPWVHARLMHSHSSVSNHGDGAPVERPASASGRVPVGGDFAHPAVAGTRLGVHRPRLRLAVGQCRRGCWGGRSVILSRLDRHGWVSWWGGLLRHLHLAVVGYGLRRRHGGRMSSRHRGGRSRCGRSRCGRSRCGRHGGSRHGGSRSRRGGLRDSGIRWRRGGRGSDTLMHRGGLANGRRCRGRGEDPGGHARQHQDERGARHQGDNGATQTEHGSSPSVAHGNVLLTKREKSPLC